MDPKLTRQGRRRLSKVAFWLWAVLLFATATSLMAGHLYALPRPERGDPAMARALTELRDPGRARGWLTVHVLYAKCRCSRRILTHLTSTERPAGVEEKLLLIGSSEELAEPLAALRRKKFAIVSLGERELGERFHVQAAPLMLVLDPEDDVVYSGGYTERKQGPNIADLRILRELMEERSALELPVLGCAVSKQLQELLDPFALRARGP